MRALEIGSTLGEAIAQGHRLAFVTLTMRHDRTDSLASMFEATSAAWRRVTTGRRWVQDQERFGVAGWVRVWEVTVGKNGWHVHAHAVVVLGQGADQSTVEALGASMFERWSAGVEAAGFRRPLRKGQDWHLVSGRRASAELGSYLAKMQNTEAVGDGLGLELAYSMPGRSREALKTRPVWSLLDDLRETGEIGRWREWETASKGRRQVGWSRGLRDRFGVLDEQSDEDIVATEVGSDDDTVARLSAAEWGRLVAVPSRPLDVLQAVKRDGVAAGLGLLDAWGILWTPGSESDERSASVGAERHRRPPAAEDRTAPPLPARSPGRTGSSELLELVPSERSSPSVLKLGWPPT